MILTDEEKWEMIQFLEDMIQNVPVDKDDIKTILKVAGDRMNEGFTVQEVVDSMGRDMLDHMFKRNKQFTEFAIANNPRAKEMNMEPETFRLRNTIAMMKEIGEYTDNIPYKWWGRGTWEMHKEAAGEELIDLLHFLFIAFDDLGWSAIDIYRNYIKKNDENWKRFREQEEWGENVELKSRKENYE